MNTNSFYKPIGWHFTIRLFKNLMFGSTAYFFNKNILKNRHEFSVYRNREMVYGKCRIVIIVRFFKSFINISIW